MMSIFSSFDALSAEILGQKVNHSCAPPTSDNKQQQRVGPLVSDRKIAVSPPSISATGKLNKTEEAPPPSSSSKSPSRPRRPKFAPELDGVYCFETIPPY
uniref:Putative ovule protein n=1 Tax=Solanum chacoense TaxID=4108 RepID=A0A0V0H5A9_SOLCH